MAELSTTRKLWKRISEIFRSTLTNEADIGQMERYFSMFRSFEYAGGEMKIGVDDELRLDWFDRLYAKPLSNALVAAGEPSESKVVFVIANKAEDPKPEAPVDSKAEPTAPPAAEPVADKPSYAAEKRPEASVSVKPRIRNPYSLMMDENYTFENFVKGPSNSFAYAEAVAVAKAPGRTAYNPLFIWGQTGLGKTHIMQAIGHRAIENFPGISVCYITAENFLNQYVNALNESKIMQLRQRFRKVDVLLIDDVQFIAKKYQIQEEFFNTFNILMSLHKQIVMTSDVPPRTLQKIEERLISRFEGGMVTEIESPSYETRLAILKLKASAYNRPIAQDILSFIAENIKSHVRALEGALRKIMAFQDVNPDFPMTIEAVKRLLKGQIEEEKVIKDLTLDDIQKVTAEYYGVKVSDILSSERTQSMVTPRQVAMFLCRKLTMHSLQEIAKKFNKSHATIHHGMTQIQGRASSEAKLRNDMTEITIKLGRTPKDLFNEEE